MLCGRQDQACVLPASWGLGLDGNCFKLLSPRWSAGQQDCLYKGLTPLMGESPGDPTRKDKDPPA